MAVKRVTMQDIADACGVSRNTVSKVFNNRGAVPEATRRMVLARAEALGYRQLPGEAAPNAPAPGGNVAVLSRAPLPAYHFRSVFLPAFAERLSQDGYTLAMYYISPEELKEKRLPMRMDLEALSGIVGIELFDKDYMDMLCELDIPVVFADAYAGFWHDLLKCDIIMMENIASTQAVTRHMLDMGAKRVGFVGDIDHCASFRERWLGFNLALSDAGLTPDRSACVMEPDGRYYGDPDWLTARLRELPALPDAFFCCNDHIAIALMTALKRLGLSIPGDVMVVGFDGQPQSGVVDPGLTTVRIPSAEIGRTAAAMLLRRVRNPEMPLLALHVKTQPVYRASTDRRGR